MNPFQSLPEYERFVYTLQLQFPELASSTLILQRRGRFLAELTGEIFHRTTDYADDTDRNCLIREIREIRGQEHQ